MEVPEITETEKEMENQRLAISKLMERMRSMYLRIEEKGNTEQTGAFIRELKDRLEPVLNN